MSRRGLLLALLLALAAVAAAPAGAAVVRRPHVTMFRGDGSYTKASRGVHSIRSIVIHATDGGSFNGNVWWLSGGHSHASAHYVVARDGDIAQLVHLSDIAWHAGNWNVNVHSIGVEHVGDTYDPAGFTIDQYRSSAQLVAWLARRYSIPIDRQHIIGHYQVPDPNDPDLSGGASHHTDPGPYWKWDLYMRLVRRFAFPPTLDVRSSTIHRGQTLAGIVPWRASTSVAHGGRASRVDFIVDGEVLWSDHTAPFGFGGGRGWNTTSLSNGPHVLVVRAVGRGGPSSVRYVVRVHNLDFALTTSALHDWQKVRGVVQVRANVRGARTTGIQLFVDGKAVSRDRTSPYHLAWNSHHAGDGRHVILLRADAIDGRVSTRRVVVVVENRPRPKAKAKVKAKPAPKPLPRPKPNPVAPPVPAPAVTSQTLADGQTVQGAVPWSAQVGGSVARVEFVVDGAVRATATAAPWSYTWDTTKETPGAHVLTVRAVAADGRSAQADATVTIAAPEPAPSP